MSQGVRSRQAADVTPACLFGPAPPMNRRRSICLCLSAKRRQPHGAVCQLSINTHAHARAGILRSAVTSRTVEVSEARASRRATAENKSTKHRASHPLLASDSSTLSLLFHSRDKLFTKVQSGAAAANQSLHSDNSFVILMKLLSPSPPNLLPTTL